MTRRYINTRKTRRHINKRAARSKPTRHHTRRKKHTKGGDNTSVKTMLDTNMQQRRDTNVSNVLEPVCKNPDSCIALGQYDTLLRAFFEEFKNLSYVDLPNTKRIGAPSKNGFVIEMPFKKDGYTARTVLKCGSDSTTSNNILYESFVGKYFINRYLKKLPCFVETYDLYVFKTNELYESAKHAYTNSTTPDYDIINSIDRVNLGLDKFNKIDPSDMNTIFEYSCQVNKQSCVLIQHFDRFYQFLGLWKTKASWVKKERLNIYYQIYYALCILGDSYTHYDLHANNIVLYKPFDGNQYILMRYHRGQAVYEFKSEYIAKIINYGRNYFDDGVLSTPKIINEYVCASSACKPDCGINAGYANLQGLLVDDVCEAPEDRFQIYSSTKPNISHDLLAATNTYGSAKHDTTGGLFKIKYNTAFGTPEVTRVSPKDSPVIRNIFDMRRRAEEILYEYNAALVAEKYDSTWKHAATMDIYDDGREYTMQYT